MSDIFFNSTAVPKGSKYRFVTIRSGYLETLRHGNPIGTGNTVSQDLIITLR